MTTHSSDTPHGSSRMDSSLGPIRAPRCVAIKHAEGPAAGYTGLVNAVVKRSRERMDSLLSNRPHDERTACRAEPYWRRMGSLSLWRRRAIHIAKRNGRAHERSPQIKGLPALVWHALSG